MRNALAHVPKGQQTVVAAALRQAFLQADQATARQVWRQVADQLRPRWPRLAALMDDSELDVLAYMGLPVQHRTKLHSTNPLERLNKEVKRRADVVGIFPNEASIARPTMLPVSSGGRWWIEAACERSMASGSAPAC
jgi:transposase-like protein